MLRNIAIKFLLLIAIICPVFGRAQMVRLGPTGKQVTGVLGEVNGGTSESSYTTGDTLYASGADTLSKRAIGSQYQVLQVNGAAVPVWDAIQLNQAAAVSGVLSVGNWSPLTTEGDLLYHNGATTTRLARGADTECLTSTATTIQWGTCGGGGVTGSGTATFLPIWTGATSLGDSPASDTGTYINFADRGLRADVAGLIPVTFENDGSGNAEITNSGGGGTATATFSGGTFTTGTAGVGSGILRLNGSTSGTGVISVAPVAGTPASIRLPTATGAASTFLQTNGASPQQTSWATAVTSVDASFTGGLISVGGVPFTTTGTIAMTVAGTSGGVPYFSSPSTWASSGALTANLPVIGGGAGAAPTVGTRSGNTTKFVTMDGSSPATNDCAKWDADDNLTTSGSPCGSGGGSTVDIQLFEVADTGTNWTLPTDGQWVEVTLCGGGGGGGGGSGAAAGSVRAGGGGGGGGFCLFKAFQASDISSPVTITVGDKGSKGTGGTNTSGTDGGPGGTSSFGSYIIAPGGGGGGGNNTGAAGGGGAGCYTAGSSANTANGVAGGSCIAVGAANTTTVDGRGAGSGTSGTGGGSPGNAYIGGATGSGSSTTGAAITQAGGASVQSGAGAGAGAGVNAANPGTEKDAVAGGDSGPAFTSIPGGGGAPGLTASNCGSGGEGQPGNVAINTYRPGGQGGGGGASKNSTTGCNGGAGGYGGGGGGGGGGGTNTGGDGGDGGPGYVLIVTYF